MSVTGTPEVPFVKTSPKEVFGWKIADLAWSAFDTTVTTALLGPYFLALIEDNGGSVNVAGLSINQTSYFPYALGLSSLLQVLLLPLWGALADHTELKKKLIIWPAYMAGIATVGLYFVTVDTIVLGGILFLIASVSFGMARVVYDSLLPLIAEPKDRDRVSAGGFAWGYLGGFIYLLVNLLLFNLMADNLGLAARLSLAGSGVWCIIFIYLGPHRYLQDRPAANQKPPGASWVRFSFSALFTLIAEMRRKYPQAFRYLISYLIFIDAVSAVISLATTFADKELNIDSGTLLLVILMIQFVAIPGSIFFGRLAERIGAKKALILNLSIWTILVLAAYLFMTSELDFWILGGCLALVLGGSRSLSRSLFSQMIPADEEARYFGLYQMSANGSSWAAPFIFGLVAQSSGSVRLAILPLAVFFALAIAVMLTVDVRAGALTARPQEQG